jgi:hypothetical protein
LQNDDFSLHFLPSIVLFFLAEGFGDNNGNYPNKNSPGHITNGSGQRVDVFGDMNGAQIKGEN